MKVSIVTISYNQGEYLERAIRSVVEQSYDDLEYIVIDGGSDDGSVEIIREYESAIDYWHSEPDEGPPNGLNKGLKRATGDIFGFLNADDFYLPGALETVAEVFRQRPEIDVVSGHGRHVNEHGDLIRPIYSDRWNLERYLYGAVTIVQQATFAKLDKVREAGGFVEQNSTCWDGELWVDLARIGTKWRRIDQELAAFRLHDASISGSEEDLPGHGALQYREDRARMRRKVLGDSQPSPAKRTLAELRTWIAEPRNSFFNLLGKLAVRSETMRQLFFGEARN